MDDKTQVHAGQRLIVHEVQDLSVTTELLAAEHAEASAFDALVLIDRQHRYVSADESLVRLLGEQRAELTGQPVGLHIGLNTYEELIRPYVERAFAGELTALLLVTTHETMGALRLAAICYPCLGPQRQTSYVLMRLRDAASGSNLRQAALRRKQRQSVLHSLDIALSGDAKLEKIGALAAHSLLEQTASHSVTVWQWRAGDAPLESAHERAHAPLQHLGPDAGDAGQVSRKIVAAASSNGGLMAGEQWVIALEQQQIVLGELVIVQGVGRTVRGELREFVDAVAERLAQALFREHLHTQLQEYTASLERIAAQRTQEVTRRRHTAAGLHEILGLLIANRPLSAILDHIVRQAERLLGADAVAILEVQENGDDASCAPLPFEDPFSNITPADLAQVQPTINRVAHKRQPVMGDNAIWVDDSEGRYRSHLAAPMTVADTLVGVVVFFFLVTRALTAEEVETAAVLTDEILFAVESARLQQRAQEGAALKERERLANELHDAVTQSVYSLTLFARAGQRHANLGDLPRVQDDLRQLSATAEQTMKQMRLLLYELRPNVLEQIGLLGALHQRLAAVEKGAGIDARLEIAGPFRLPSHVEDGLYRIAQEALNNVLRHSSASQVVVRIQADGDIVILEIADDGVGFDVTPELEGPSVGVNQMRARAEALNADLTIESAPGQGTHVRVAVLVPGIGATMRSEIAPTVDDTSDDVNSGSMPTGTGEP